MAETASTKGSWDKDGFIILRGFFSHGRIQEINQLLDSLWNNRHFSKNPLIIDAISETNKHKRMLFREAADEVRNYSYKLNDLYLESKQIRDLVLDVELCSVLEKLLNGPPMVCNTLNFEFGSEQADHIDTFYMPPRKTNRMLATWIALDSVAADNGPVRYFPGSHKIPPYLFSHGKTNAIQAEMPTFRSYIQNELEKRNIEPTTLSAEPGDVLIWHAQLLHGGLPIVERQKPRKSLVTHYFCRDDYRHLLWRVRQAHSNGYYYARRHQALQ